MASAQRQLFSGGVQISNLILSSEHVHQAWFAISELNRSNSSYYDSDGVKTTSQAPFLIRSATFHLNKSTIIAFSSFQEQQQQLLEFLPLTLRQNDRFFEFLSAKDIPSFGINETVLSLFLSHSEHYHQILDSETPLILVGHSLGGAVAALFTIWLIKKLKPSAVKTLPLCITFGSPLFGDDGLCRAVNKHKRWSSRFLHVIANHDPVPRSFISNRATSNGYKPLGTFLFCSQLGSAGIDDPASVMELMKGTPESLVLDQRHGHYGYGEILHCLRERIVHGGAVANTILSSLRTGLTLQLRAIGIGDETQHAGIAESLIASMEEREEKNYLEHKKAIVDGGKKLNEIQGHMACMEWYKKFCMMRDMSYYDCYKSPGEIITEDSDIIKFKIRLNLYWEEMVLEAENKPKEGSAFRTGYLFAGNYYRRMVEPLDIADYYKRPGNKNYRTNRRPRHYTVLEKWHVEERVQRQSTKAPSLTEDSCFWADVEDVVIDLQELQERRNRAADMESGKLEELRGNLKKFESYVMGLIEKSEVSTDIFLKNSSFMMWWGDYERDVERVMAPNYHSSLTHYMKNQMYKGYH